MFLLLAWRLLEETETALALGVSTLGFLFVLFLFARATEHDAHDHERDKDNEYERAKLDEESGQADQKAALKLFQVHSSELRRYYDQALHQAHLIFWVGVAALGLGFAAIGAALALLAAGERVLPELSDKIIVSGLGAVAGILANFIGVIYIRMHSATVRSLSEFHNRLVSTNYLHFANFLVAKIEKGPPRSSALASVAEAIALGQAQAATPQEAVLKLNWAPQPTPNSTPAGRVPPGVP